jgi:tRNA/rRNA methyltransferase
LTSGRQESKSDVLTPFSGFAVAVVEPEFGQNVGYMARVMANFGLIQLYIVTRRKIALDETEALRFSSHGYYVIERAKYLNSLDELREKFQVLIGTTAIRGKRKSNITRKTYSLEDAIPRISRYLHHSGFHGKKKPSYENSERLCFVFGRDTTGLTNDELRKCDYNITIFTGTKYNTLNISHAAAIIFYVFRCHFLHHLPYSRQKDVFESEPSRKEKDLVVTLFQELASISDFQEYKKERLHETLTRILNRSNPSLRELYLLMGLASKAQTKIKILSV